MNGRVYDARLGRFIQADPTIDGVTSTQGFNRYSYVQNNPLNATDPSGFGALRDLWRSGKGYVGIVLTIIAVVFCPVCVAGLLNWVITSFAIGAISGAVQTGSLVGTVSGAFSGAINAWAGGAGGIIGSALAGGVTWALQGGNFANGFLAAGVGALAGGALSGAGPELQFIGRTIVGGTTSVITGGKFKNGALTAAFQMVATAAATLPTLTKSSNLSRWLRHRAYQAPVAATQLTGIHTWALHRVRSTNPGKPTCSIRLNRNTTCFEDFALFQDGSSSEHMATPTQSKKRSSGIRERTSARRAADTSPACSLSAVDLACPAVKVRREDQVEVGSNAVPLRVARCRGNVDGQRGVAA